MWSAASASGWRPRAWDAVGIVLVAYFLAFVGSEFGQVFTNAMLPDLGPRREIGRISGSGWALGYLGGLVSLVVVLALARARPGSDRTLIGIAADPRPRSGRSASRRAPPGRCRRSGTSSSPCRSSSGPRTALPGRRPGSLRTGLADLARHPAAVRRHRSLFAFLVASMVYRDALAALFTFGGIYAAGVLGWGMFQLGVFGIVAAGVGTIGAWIGGRADRAFGPRPVIVASIWA